MREWLDDYGVLVVLGGLIIASLTAVGYDVWRDATHECVSGHYQDVLETDCLNTGSISTCTSVPKRRYVCDEWVKR